MSDNGRQHRQARVHVVLPDNHRLQGVISLKTLTHLAAIRSAGVLLVLITGARTSTLFQRLPCLPAADAYVSENGGRLFFPQSTMPVAVPFTEDSEWRSQHDGAGKPYHIQLSTHLCVHGQNFVHGEIVCSLVLHFNVLA